MTFFEDREFDCRCGRATCTAPHKPHPLLRVHLDTVRRLYGKPIVVTSGNRCVDHNASEGGVKHSEHVWPDGCLGVDIACVDSRGRAFLLDAIRQSGITRVGVYARHLHVGIGDAIDGEKFPGAVVWVGGYGAKG